MQGILFCKNCASILHVYVSYPPTRCRGKISPVHKQYRATCRYQNTSRRPSEQDRPRRRDHENNGNDDIILPFLIHCLQRLFLTLADKRESRVVKALNVLNEQDDVEKSRPQNTYSTQVDICFKRGFWKVVDCNGDGCGGTEDCGSTFSSDGNEKWELL